MLPRRAFNLSLTHLLAGWLVGFAASAQAGPALWVSGEVPPYLWRGANGPEGYAYELFQRVIKQADVSAELQFYPWARALLMVQGSQAQAALVITRTPERESQLRWLFPVGNFHFAVITRAADGPVGRDFESLRGRRIGSMRASASRAMLSAGDFPTVVEGKDYSELLTLLQRGVVDVVIGPEPALRTLGARQGAAPEAVRCTVLDVSRDLYAAAGPSMPEPVRQRLLAAYQHLVDSGFVAQLKKRHPDAFFDD
jgi:polar amino acid transport system substrate-binding protein